jgi:hypothetical protein
MRPTVRRIDLTQTPTTFEVWPSLDWLEPTTVEATASETVPFETARPRSTQVGGPHGRSGLWDAMASAVQRARESSLGEVATDDQHDLGDAEVIEMAVATPHLAYLARVACGDPGGRDDLPGADVIALVDARARDAG